MVTSSEALAILTEMAEALQPAAAETDLSAEAAGAEEAVTAAESADIGAVEAAEGDASAPETEAPLVEETAPAAAVPARSSAIPVPVITALAREWREGMDLEARLTLAADLWQSDLYEARIAACKLLVQARITPDEQVWEMITLWLAGVQDGGLADHLAEAGSRRVTADPSRLDVLELWVKSPHLWTRRAALTFTQPWAKRNNLKPAEAEARLRILGWAGELVADRNWATQKAIGSWIRDLSKHDAALARDFLNGPGQGLKSFARKIARSWLQD